MKNHYEIRGDITEIHMNRYGLITTIDTVDLEAVLSLGKVNWMVNISSGVRNAYVIGQINKKKYILQRFLMDAPSGMDVDHINHNTLDNRKSNLQVITRSENSSKKSKVSFDWHATLEEQIRQEKIIPLREKDIVVNADKKRIDGKSKVKIEKMRKWNEQKRKYENVKEYKII